MTEWDPIDLVMLRYLEVRGPRLQQSDGTANDKSAGHIANVINNFIASSNTLAFAGPSEGVVIGDSYKTGQAGAVGPNAVAHDMSFSQIWHQVETSIDLPKISTELEQVRTAMRKLAIGDVEQDLAIAQVAHAEKSARSDDGPSVMKHLRAAGTWTLHVARSIGAETVVAATKIALGLPNNS